MTDDEPPTDRESPVGEPVVRGDPDLLGDPASDAVAFDPDDPESLAAAAEMVREFAVRPRVADPLYVLRGAAACAALVRGEGSYKAAAERAGDDVSVAFIRKWSRVHDLPYAVRRHVAVGDIAPTAAKHVARVEGDARYLLAWAVVDDGLTVRQVRDVVGEVTAGTDVEDALREGGADLGTFAVDLPTDLYSELRRRAALTDASPEDVVVAALSAWFDERDDLPDEPSR
jgi:hypothetical protein